MGVPQDEMALSKLVKRELPPSGEVDKKVGPGAGKDQVPAAEEDIAEKQKV
jgi:hypothetical protein